MTMTLSFDIHDLFKAYNEQLRIEEKYFSNQVTHSGEKGRLNETHFASILRRYLPKKFGIGTGFVVSTNPDMPISPQCDIIIYDALQNAPLYESEAFSIFPIEMVYGVIEVKTDLSHDGELDDCLKKCTDLRSMAYQEISEEEYERSSDPNTNFQVCRDERKKPIRCYKGYFRHEVKDGRVIHGTKFEYLAPRFFIFAYRGWQKKTTLKENFERVGSKYPHSHVHGLCIRNEKGGYFTGHLAFKSGMEKNQEVVDEDGFAYFLFRLPTMLETMLPPHPAHVGAAFDLVDLRRYQILSNQFGKNAF